ncbi:hypothetical protein AU252_11465 [Pseudarthrobacter sulfonivorans]|uniref:Peptidase C14 caspase domain-containing protein n=1 Tax=Pseudarthrobacter sulfonivorans TaxID=121292 RepID=A0A0U3QXU3_9MICC|nr:caspase family protein [Pseudarthrobacter sulfonivorans]ALV41692.1 hypothetical protein AU252_11465 [Pseudarthrobacter sulfonivorans]
MTTDLPPLPAINPARVSVLAIGLETYGDLGVDWDLPGAGLHAVRFVQWAIDHRVPPERVCLGCTWVGGLEDSRAMALAAKGVRMISTSTDGIKASASDLVENGGDLLLVYWCGHGVSTSRQRLLLTTGAIRNPEQLTNFRIDDLQTLLAAKSEDIAGFPNQVMFFDACANELEGRRLPNPGDWGEFPNGRPQQLLYYSTDIGLYADFDKDAGRAAYSTELLTWLEGHTDAFPPDFARLSDHVHRRFHEKKDEFINRPVRLYTGVSGEGGAEFVYESASLALQPSQLLAVEQAVEQALIRAPELMTSESQSVRSIFASGGGDDFVRAMEDRAEASDIDRLLHAAEHVRNTYDRQKWILTPLRVIENVDLNTLRTAYRETRQGYGEIFVVEGLVQTLDHAASFWRRYHEDAPLYRLIARLEWVTGKRVDAWFRSELDSDAVARVRASSRPGETPPRIVVVFDLTEADENNDTPPQLKTHTWVANEENPRGWWEASSPRACGTTREEIARAVAEELGEIFHIRHPDGYPDTASVGFILTPDRLAWRPELWEAPVWDRRTKEVMANSLPVVLHLRRRGPYERRWKDRLKVVLERAGNGVPAVEWLSPGEKSEARTNDNICCTALNYRPLMHGDGQFEELLRTGAPFILWSDDDPSDAVAARDRITELINAGLEDFPERRRNDLRDIAVDTGFSLRIIWDHAARLPPNPNARSNEEVQ